MARLTDGTAPLDGGDAASLAAGYADALAAPRRTDPPAADAGYADALAAPRRTDPPAADAGYADALAAPTRADLLALRPTSDPLSAPDRSAGGGTDPLIGYPDATLLLGGAGRSLAPPVPEGVGTPGSGAADGSEPGAGEAGRDDRTLATGRPGRPATPGQGARDGRQPSGRPAPSPRPRGGAGGRPSADRYGQPAAGAAPYGRARGRTPAGPGRSAPYGPTPGWPPAGTGRSAPGGRSPGWPPADPGRSAPTAGWPPADPGRSGPGTGRPGRGGQARAGYPGSPAQPGAGRPEAISWSELTIRGRGPASRRPQPTQRPAPPPPTGGSGWDSFFSGVNRPGGRQPWSGRPNPNPQSLRELLDLIRRSRRG